MNSVKVINFGREYTIPEYFTKDEFKEIILKNFDKLEILNQSAIPDKEKIGLSHFYMAISGLDDKFVAIENLKISNEDLEYLFELNKQYLLVATPFYNKETNELFEIGDVYHFPKLIETFNKSRPAFLFYDMNTAKDIPNLIEELTLFLTSDEAAVAREIYIKQELDSIFEQFSDTNCLLVFNNSFYGNFKKSVVQYDYHQEFTFHF